MTGAGLRKTALLAALAAAAACCLGSSGGRAGATAAAAGGGGGAPAARERGPLVNAGPLAAPKVKAIGAKTRLTVRPPANGVGVASAAAARDSTYTNPWRYCPGDIQLTVGDGEGCDEWWLAASYVDSGVTHYGLNAVTAWQTTMGQGVTIGLLSSGADPNDPDYADNLAPGGHNYVDGNSDTTDTYGTGTVLTGVMAAEANNGGFVG